MNSSRDRLFHVLVTLGIAAGTEAGCDSLSRSSDSDSDEGAGGSSGSDPSRTGGTAGAPATGGAIATGGAVATGGAIAIGGAIATGGTGISFGGGFGFGGEGGAACDSTAQITCLTYEPEPLDCYCDPNAPITSDDCDNRNFVCYSYDPPLGCACVFITGPR